MSQILRFEMPRVETVVQGVGAVSQLREELERRGLARAVLVTGRSVGSSEHFSRLANTLGELTAGVYTAIRAHNPVEQIIDLIEFVRGADADALVAIGGGSAIDAAKLAAAGISEGCRSVADLTRNYVQFEYPDKVRVRPLDGTPMPVLAVPTTLSAAEWDGFAGSVDHTRDTKDLTCYLELTPKVVVLDPEFCSHTPRELWATTGVRALDHAVETAYAKNAHPFTTALANDALAALAEHLPISVLDPTNYEAALRCQQAAWMAIIGVHNVSLGLSHAIGHQLGAIGIPHGVTSCIMLPHVMRFLEPVTAEKQRAMAMSMAGVRGDFECELTAAQHIERILDELAVPRRISEFDVGRDKLAVVAKAALGDIVVRESPRTVDESAIRDLLENAW